MDPFSEPDALDDSTATLGSGTDTLTEVLSVTFSKLGVLIEMGCWELQLSVITLDSASAMAIATRGTMLALWLGFGASSKESAKPCCDDCSAPVFSVIAPSPFKRPMSIINGMFLPGKSVPSV